MGRRPVWGLVLVLSIVVVLTPYCKSPEPDETRSPYLNHGDSARYVGMETCAQCHLDKKQTFVHTGMGMSFDTVSPEKSSANLHTHHVLYDSFKNFYYYPHWKGSDLYVREFRLNGGDTTYLREEKITYIIGSGQHTNSHLIRKGDYVVQAPFTWYAQKGKLDFPPGFENGHNSRFRRVIDEECMSCHNGLPTMKAGSMRAFAQIPDGIDCERCHGPGSIHVKKRLGGYMPETDIDYSIVNPSKLSWERQIDVCQRCHLQGNNVLKSGKSFHDFKPGMVLSDVFEVFLPQYQEGDQLFNMANHSDRFQNSQCFLQTNKGGDQVSFTCITCHNPHVSVKETSNEHFINACKSCHKASNTCSEKNSVRMVEGDNCITCHMPLSGTEDIPHVSVHDHKIGIHKQSDRKSEEGTVIGLYSVNNTKTDNRTMIQAYLTYYEKFDQLPIYQKKAEELLRKEGYTDLWIHLFYQQQNWRSIISTATTKELPDPDAATCYRVGKAYANTSMPQKAVEWLQLAVLKDDSYFEYKSDLGANLIKVNKPAEAEGALLKCLSQFPEYTPAMNNLGFLYIGTRQWGKAKYYLEESLKYDPDNLNAKENLVLLYSQTGGQANEIFWLREILKQKPTHEVARKRLSQLTSIP